jgi:hypothetical protein
MSKQQTGPEVRRIRPLQNFQKSSFLRISKKRQNVAKSKTIN